MACPTKTITPETDATPIPCDGCFIFDECVTRETAITYLSLPANSNMLEIVDALVASLQNARDRIIVLEEIVETYETRLTALETP